MDRPMALCNRSISNCSHSDDSSQSYSVSTLGSSKLGSCTVDSSNHLHSSWTALNNKNNTNKKKKKNGLRTSSHHRSKDPKSNSSHHSKPKQKMRRKCNNNNSPNLRRRKSLDRLAVSVHTSDSDLKNSQRRTARMGLDRQLSISRWMADAVNEHCGKIRRAVSSHEALSAQEKPLSPELLLVESSSSNRQNYNPAACSSSTTTNSTAANHAPTMAENSPFKLFRRANSHNPLSKPVRKRSSGPEGLIKDVLMALSGHERNHESSSSTSSKIFLPFSSSNNTNSTSGTSADGIANLIGDDIEEDDDDSDSEQVEFHSDNDDDEDVHSTTPIPDQTPLLLQQGSRWDASSPSRENNKEMRDVPPLDRLLRGSSKKMPVPPPPPFSPSNNNKGAVQHGLDVVPNDLFQSGTNATTPNKQQHSAEGGNTPCKPLRANSNRLRESLNNKTLPLAPLAAASAAIAIATASMEEDDDDDDDYEEVFSEDEVVLNDLVSSTKTRLQSNCYNNNTTSCESSSNGDTKTDAATADSAANSDRETWDDYSEDISVDGVSMLSASNTTFTSFTATTHQSNSVAGLGSSGTGSLAAYMNRVQREVAESKKYDHRNNHKNGQPDLGSYMNWAKRRQQQEEEEEQQQQSQQQHQRHQQEEDQDSKRISLGSLDFSYKSIAEDTFESVATFATFGYESPQQQPKEQPKQHQQRHLPLSLPIRACSDHHPVLALSRRDASIVPPCMPKRSVSNHEKLDIAPRTPKSQQQTNTNTANTDSPPTSATASSGYEVPTKSPSGDRVQRLLDAANKRKHNNQRFRRRVTMDHAPSSSSNDETVPETSMRRRRASLDHSLLSSHSTRSSSNPPKQRQPSLTSTITKTPRTSPSMVRQRKRLNSHDSLLAPCVSPHSTTPINTRNLSDLAADLVDNDRTTRTSHLIEK